MGYEVDFLAVGDAGRSGDAIAVRWGNLFGPRSEQTVAIIDGGFTACGDQLVEHVKARFGTDWVDVVISTHPDADHVNGLSRVVQGLGVSQLWMHLPSEHSIEMQIAKTFGWKTIRAVRENLAKSLEAVTSLEETARSLGIPIVEPFSGLTTPCGGLSVVGPTKEYYESLLPGFRTYQGQSVLSKAVEAVRRFIAETFDDEKLDDSGETSPENNSSVISVLQVDGKSLVFTGDAGMPALLDAAQTLDSVGFDWSSVAFMQIPHHGSRRNVGPTVLDRFLGPKGQTPNKSAIVSAAPDGAPKHPSKKVTNAFQRRGAVVCATVGTNLLLSDGAPIRPDYGPTSPLPFYTEVDE